MYRQKKSLQNKKHDQNETQRSPNRPYYDLGMIPNFSRMEQNTESPKKPQSVQLKKRLDKN